MSTKQLADLDFGSAARILNLPVPTDPAEPARLSDLNSAVEGLSWKDSVVVATQANLNLASPGAAVDGVTMSASDRMLVKAQTLPEENGIYIWNAAATPATRAVDASTADELEQAVTTVEEGTSAGSSWRQTSVNFVLDTGAVTWADFGSTVSNASETTAGKIEIATQTETDTGTDDTRSLTPLKLSNWSGRLKRSQTTIGDGAATQIDVSHNFATRDVIVQIFQATGSFEQVNCDVSLPDTNTARFNFAIAPSSGAYRVVILA
jgi:hypothetical protein